jgi:glycogen operon protein
MVPVLATRLAGSSDLYQHDGRAPYHSINFVTSHDGFTLADLVSYAQKHNDGNGEYNGDGCNNNLSDNHGVEGVTDDPVILELRSRQVRNLATLLILAHGVPMLLAGDEMGRTQGGNNNAWCQDNQISWIDWGLLEKQNDLFNFFRNLIALRQRYALLRPRHFEGEESGKRRLTWHGPRLHEPDWSEESQSLGMHLQGQTDEAEIYLVAHAGQVAREFELPPLRGTACWQRFIDTSLPGDEASCAPGSECLPERQDSYLVGPQSVVVLVSSRSCAVH